jgi:uncharacterized membrane protein YdjX (TVP38/TMEM64 family)
METKQTSNNPAPESPEQKKGETTPETKGGIVQVVTAVPSFVWNKAILPAFNFVKGIALRIWDGIVNTYKAEVTAFRELGAAQYFLGRGAKIGLLAVKVIAAAAVVAFLNNLLFSYTGISIFDPMTLGIVLLVSLVMVAASSYLAQKEMGEVSAKVTGQHMIEAFAAA